MRGFYNELPIQVTADVHVIQCHAFQLVVLALALGGILRSALGPLPYWLCFVLTELYKLSFMFCGGMLNVSAVLQMILITNIRLCQFN